VQSHILIYSSHISSRLKYTLDWIFTDRLGLIYELTNDTIRLHSFTGCTIVYTEQILENYAGIFIKASTLLQEQGIKEQNLSIQRWKKSTVLFYNQPGAAIPFDIFAAIFYLISRYEEYLQHHKDQHKRYAYENSVAGQYAFIQKPVVDEWLLHFSSFLEKNYTLKTQQRKALWIPTYDVDIAFRYLGKSFARHMASISKDLLRLRLSTLATYATFCFKKSNDPFDNFEQLYTLHKNLNSTSMFFLLMALQNSHYDKNINPAAKSMQKLVQQLDKHSTLGIHPSYNASEQENLFQIEKNVLEKTIHKTVTHSRQHYIKFQLPSTYQQLIKAGITHDYSMGYATINGFRAGTANAFYWYDITQEQVTSLRVHPFCFMDATSLYYQKQNKQQIQAEWRQLWQAVQKTGGTFITIAHNHLLTEKLESNNTWMEYYKKLAAETINH
jgi:hypothetical protein